MAWDVKWFLVAEQKLAPEQREALLAHAKAEAVRPWQRAAYALAVLDGPGTAAGGGTDMPDDVAHPDWTRLLAALTTLRKLVPNTQVRIEDSRGLISWNEAQQHYEMTGWQRTPEPVAQTPTPTEEELADKPVRARFAELCAGGPDRYNIMRSLPGEHDPLRVARIGIELLPTLPKDAYPSQQRSDVASVVRDALGKFPDHTSLEAQMSALFQARPDNDLPRHVASALAPAAANPALVTLAIATLNNDDSSPEVLHALCDFLLNARGAADVLVPVLVARARRDRRITGRELLWRERLLCALEFMRRPQGLPTLILDGDADPKVLWRALSGAARCDGARALPFFDRATFVRGLTPGNVVRDLGEIQTPGAIPLIARFMDHGDPSVRVAAAEPLLARRCLREVAAIWRSLDEFGYKKDSYSRERALRAFGFEYSAASAATTVDWDALVRSRGEEPLPLAPPPRPLEALTHPDVNVRNAGRSAIDDGTSPTHLLAICLALRLEVAIHRRGGQRTYPSFWKWRELLTSLGFKQSADEEIAEAVCQAATQLPPQELSAELQAILDGGLDAAAQRCAVELPEFKLTDEERQALDAEEERVAAQAGQPKAPPERIEAEDLFSGTHPEAEGPALDPRDAEYPLRPDPEDVQPNAVVTADDAIVELHEGQALLTIKSGPVLPSVVFRGLVRSRTRWLRLDAVEVVLRDGTGAPLQVLSETVEKGLRPAGRVGLSAYPDANKLAQLRSVEVHAVVRRPLQVQALRGVLPPLSFEFAGNVELKDVNTSPLLRTRTTLYARKKGEYLELEPVCELSLAQPSRTVAHCEIVLVLRGARGNVLSSRQLKRTLPADGTPVYFTDLLGLNGAQLRDAKWFELAVRGAVTARHRLCEFTR